MDKKEFKDRLFNLINEADGTEYEIADIETFDKEDGMLITLKDGSKRGISVS